MAQTVAMTYPLDQPRQQAPGVTLRENDWHGATGRWYAQPIGSEINRVKGNLGNANIPNFDSRALTTPGAPYTLKR